MDNFMNRCRGVDALTDSKDDGWSRGSVLVGLKDLSIGQLASSRKGNQRRAAAAVIVDGSRAVENSSGTSSTNTTGLAGARKRLSFRGGTG